MAKGLKKGAWSEEEDTILRDWVAANGPRKWSYLRSKGLLRRAANSCRLRWLNKLRPGLNKGRKFSPEEAKTVVELQAHFGNKWARIAEFFPGCTGNDLKYFWGMWKKRLAQSSLLSVLRSETDMRGPEPVVSMNEISTDDHQPKNLNLPYGYQCLEAMSATPALTRPTNNPCNSKAALPSAPFNDPMPHQKCLSGTPATPVYPPNTKFELPSAIGFKNFRRFSLEQAEMLQDLQADFGNDWARMAGFFPGHTEDDMKNFWSIQKKRLAGNSLLSMSRSETTMHGPGVVVPRNEIHAYEKRWYKRNAERLDAIRELRKLPHLVHFKAWRQQEINSSISIPERPKKKMPPVTTKHVRAIQVLQHHRSMVHFKAWRHQNDPTSNVDLLYQVEKKSDTCS